MTTHMITVISYVVLGIGLMVPASFLIATPTDALKKGYGHYLTPVGVVFMIEYRRIIEMYFMLFGVFIFACAIDHYTADHPWHFQPWFVRAAADFEALVSGLTALLFALGPVAIVWRRFVLRWSTVIKELRQET